MGKPFLGTMLHLDGHLYTEAPLYIFLSCTLEICSLPQTNTKIGSLVHMMMNNTIFIWVPLIIFLLSLLIILKTKVSKHNKKLIPPSPPKLPFLGHLHLISSLPHRSFFDLSKKYGPVMLLQLGSVPTVVISSASVARDLFKLHDLASCSRAPLSGTGRLSYNYLDISFSPYGDHWREVRKICVLELFSAKRVQSFQSIREQEVGLLLNSISRISSSSIDLSEEFYSLTANIITRVAFGKSFRGGELDDGKFHVVVRRALAALGSFSATDFFPTFGWIIDRLNGVHGRLEKSFGELDAFFQHVIDDRINFGTSSHNYEENIVDVLLKLKNECSEFDVLQLTTDCIKAIIMDIFLAGVDTGASVLAWTMTELARNPRVMKKLQDEIRNYTKEDRVKETELENLEYLKMVVKESIRLHVPAPLLLTRETTSSFQLDGYDIEPKVQLHVNAWAIARDPEYWINPEEFWPERFVGSNVDYRGQNFELLPFGAGRRICPAMNMAIPAVELTLANLLLCFDWKLPNGMKEEDLSIDEDPGLTVTKKIPLQLVPLKYSRV